MPSPLPACVSVRDLTKRYGLVAAVGGISFDVAAGEIFGLLGPNGAGKTTTLECILGLRRPDSGTITLGGIDALAQPEQAKVLVGAQLQSATLQDKITPRQALEFFASFYRIPADSGGLLTRFALMDKADAPFDSLSDGQQQRLFLALAFINNPQLVVLDEPTAGLDPQARRELHQVIIGLRTAGRTVLLSTHDLEEAHQLCDRIGILDRGRIIAVATPAELVARAGTNARVAVKTMKPFDATLARSLPGVVSCEPQGDGWLLGTTDANRTVTGLVQSLDAAGNQLRDLQIFRPTLEDVFIELTGRAWPPPAPEDKG
ncbi:MAG: ABC transporter ATP-binding protein [Opitutaceae bacterium]